MQLLPIIWFPLKVLFCCIELPPPLLPNGEGIGGVTVWLMPPMELFCAAAAAAACPALYLAFIMSLNCCNPLGELSAIEGPFRNWVAFCCDEGGVIPGGWLLRPCCCWAVNGDKPPGSTVCCCCTILFGLGPDWDTNNCCCWFCWPALKGIRFCCMRFGFWFSILGPT